MNYLNTSVYHSHICDICMYMFIFNYYISIPSVLSEVPEKNLSSKSVGVKTVYIDVKTDRRISRSANLCV